MSVISDVGTQRQLSFKDECQFNNDDSLDSVETIPETDRTAADNNAGLAGSLSSDTSSLMATAASSTQSKKTSTVTAANSFLRVKQEIFIPEIRSGAYVSINAESVSSTTSVTHKNNTTTGETTRAKQETLFEAAPNFSTAADQSSVNSSTNTTTVTTNLKSEGELGDDDETPKIGTTEDRIPPTIDNMPPTPEHNANAGANSSDEDLPPDWFDDEQFRPRLRQYFFKEEPHPHQSLMQDVCKVPLPAPENLCKDGSNGVAEGERMQEDVCDVPVTAVVNLREDAESERIRREIEDEKELERKYRERKKLLEELEKAKSAHEKSKKRKKKKKRSQSRSSGDESVSSKRRHRDHKRSRYSRSRSASVERLNRIQRSSTKNIQVHADMFVSPVRPSSRSKALAGESGDDEPRCSVSRHTRRMRDRHSKHSRSRSPQDIRRRYDYERAAKEISPLRSCSLRRLVQVKVETQVNNDSDDEINCLRVNVPNTVRSLRIRSNLIKVEEAPPPAIPRSKRQIAEENAQKAYGLLDGSTSDYGSCAFVLTRTLNIMQKSENVLFQQAFEKHSPLANNCNVLYKSFGAVTHMNLNTWGLREETNEITSLLRTLKLDIDELNAKLREIRMPPVIEKEKLLKQNQSEKIAQCGEDEGRQSLFVAHIGTQTDDEITNYSAPTHTNKEHTSNTLDLTGMTQYQRYAITLCKELIEAEHSSPEANAALLDAIIMARRSKNNITQIKPE